jgi:hypothetical protein
MGDAALSAQEVDAMSRICQMTGTRAALAAAGALCMTAAAAWAQVSPTPAPMPSPEMTNGSGAFMVVAALVVVLLIAVGVMVKLYDLRRKREDEAVALQARLSDALLAEPSLSSLPLVPTVRIPMRGSPVSIEIVGTVPRPELRQAAVDLVVREAARSVKSYRVDARISIDSMMQRRAA